MNEFILLDAAILGDCAQFEALTRAASAVPLYADLPSVIASQLGPWLLEAAEFQACVPGDEPGELPWRYGVSRLSTETSRASLVVHFESQRSIAMEDGDRYYLRFADTRALDVLTRVLTPEQMMQLKGPIARWHYVNRFGEAREFGGELPADLRRHDMIVLSDAQGAALFEQQLAASLADYVAARRRDVPFLDAGEYAHVETSVAFVLRHGIEPLQVQQHIAAAAVETHGMVFHDARFQALVESSRASGQWDGLMTWRPVSTV